MQARSFYVVLGALVLGIGVGVVWVVPTAVALWSLVLGCGLAGWWRGRSEASAAPHLLLLCLVATAFAIGLLRAEVASWQFGHSPLASLVGSTVTIEGVVVREPDYRERTLQLYVKTNTDTILVSADRLTHVAYGDVVQVEGELEQPTTFTTDLGREFNYAGYLRARGVEYKISFATVTVAGSGMGNPVIASLLGAKERFIASLEQIIPEPAVGLGNGLLLGVQSGLGEAIEQDFRRTGIIHIVVLSGYNVMLVVAFVLFCLSYVLPLRSRIVVSVVAIVVFAVVVGLSATVVRASVMASLVLLAQLLRRRYNVLRALLAAGALMLLINPYLLIYDIGFQLSFMATLGLILIVPQFESTVATRGLVGVREFFLATVATQIAVLPLLMYHIGEVSLIAVVVNVLVLPLVPAAMLLTFLTGLIGFVSVPLASLLGYAAFWTLEYILQVAAWFAALPYAAVSVPAFGSLGVLVLYVVMVGVWYWRQRAPDPLRGWTIVDEPEPPSRLARDEVPVFFK